MSAQYRRIGKLVRSAQGKTLYVLLRVGAAYAALVGRLSPAAMPRALIP